MIRLAILIISILFFSLSTYAQTTQNACNCCTEKHAEFDFWIGTWTVTNPDGTAAGNNKLEKIQDNCILRENWISATPGYTGTSYNFYNAQKQLWEQIWVDNQGGTLHLKGNRIGNKMILKTDEQSNADGQKFYHRVTWTKNEDGSVRQYWETITNGNDISVAFDGLYKKSE
jgi:hypothetical protein